MIKNSRGVSNIGCLFTLAIVVAGFYVGYKLAYVQWNLETFKEKMTEATRFWANEKPEDFMIVKNDVLRRTAECGFALTAENIAVSIEGAYIIITVSWKESIVFPGYVYERPIEVTRRIRRLGY